MIKVVAGEHVVCDCRGVDVDSMVESLLVGINVSPCQVTVTVMCPECASSMKFRFNSYVVTTSQSDT